MFSTALNKTDLNQISLTGTRAIVLLGLLMIAPRSMEEIKKAFISYKIMEDSNSEDVIRIDINSLKHVGCKVSRSSQKTGFKYVLGEHPFSLKLSKEDIRALKKVYGEIKKEAGIGLLIEYDELFKKIAKFVSNEKDKEALLGISVLKHYKDFNLLKEIITDCRQERVLGLKYLNPLTNKTDKKNIQTKQLVFNNDKIYLYGYDIDNKIQTVLNFKRIKQIFSRSLQGGGNDIKERSTNVKFKLENVGTEELSDEEIIIEASDNGYIVEGRYYNEFFAMQRILSFGPNCSVLEPSEFKESVIKKLKEMRDIYGK